MSRKSKVRRPKEVFLSHSSTDRRAATRLAVLLRESGVKVWYSETHIKGGQQWHDEIGRALARCDWFLVLLSPAAVRSPWVKHELLHALTHSQYHERIIPLNYRKCNYERLSWALGGFQFVNVTGTLKAGSDALLERWKIDPQRSVVSRRKRKA